MKPLFIQAHSGPLFSIFFAPNKNDNQKAILHIPAFAEEMNKSRQMVALQARDFVQRGYAVLIIDLFGTGDSAGQFGDATWEIWLQDIECAIAWLKQQGRTEIDLWGLRIGCLLAMDFVSNHRQLNQNLLFWQPVLNGDVFVTQFLRLRIAAAMMDSNAPKEKTADLKKQIQEGQGIEVAGYLLNPKLINPLMNIQADKLNVKGIAEIALFEVTSNPDSPVSLANTQFLSSLHANHIEASLTKVIGNTFWANQEITENPDLITASNKKLEEWL